MRGAGGGGGGAGGALAATGAGVARRTAGGASSATTVFFGRPRGFFTGSTLTSTATTTAFALGEGVFGAVFTAAGASPLSLYGFGSSPCAVLRGERGPRPGEGRRGSVMSSICYWLLGTARCEITGAQGARIVRRLFGTIVTSPATPSGTMRGHETVAMEKSGRVMARTTAIRHSNAATIRQDGRSWTYRANRDGTHTLRLARGIQAGGQSATPTSDAHVRGRAPAWTRRASNSQTLGAQYRHTVTPAQAVIPSPAQFGATAWPKQAGASFST